MPKPNRGCFLERHDNGHWYVCWFDRGRKKSRSTCEKDRGLAEKVLAHHILNTADEQQNASDPAVADLLARYLEHYARGKVASIDTTELAVSHLTASDLGAKPIRALRQRDIEVYVADRKRGVVTWTDSGKKRGGRVAGNSSIRRELVVLVAAINSQANAELMRGVPKPKFTLPPDGEARDRWLTEVELSRTLQKAAALRPPARPAKDGRPARPERLTRAERFLWLAVYTAGRRAAILEMKWDQVDFETKVIHLNPRGRKQTKKRRASVPIPDVLLAVLRRALGERKSEWVLDKPGSVRRSVGRVLEETFGDDHDVTPHTLRHTAATHMARRGVPLWKIAKVLGNSLVMVERTYAHHSPDDLREAVTMIGAPAKLSTT